MIEILILNSLIIWGVYASLQEGFIFERIGEWIRGTYEYKLFIRFDDVRISEHDNLPSWIKKPLGTCPVCMASIYGTAVFWFAYLIDYLQYDYIIVVYIGYIFALSGLNYLILSFKPNRHCENE